MIGEHGFFPWLYLRANLGFLEMIGGKRMGLDLLAFSPRVLVSLTPFFEKIGDIGNLLTQQWGGGNSLI